jgi:hypothetical protein
MIQKNFIIIYLKRYYFSYSRYALAEADKQKGVRPINN